MDALPLLRPADVDLSSGQLFRVSARAVATITIVMGVLVAACIWIGWRGGVVFGGRGMIPAVLAWWVVFWLGLFLLFYANDWRKARKPSAWLALATGEGVYLKYRSYRNLGWNQDVSQVAFVPYELIESARIERHTWLTPESQSRDTRSERVTYVELELADADLGEFEQRLADERAGKPGRSARGTRTWRHFPVSVEAGNVVRIEWRAHPGAAAFLEYLTARGVLIAEAGATTIDLRNAPDEDQLAELARRGQTLDLIRVLRFNTDMPLTQAKAEAERMIADAKVRARR